MLLLLAVGLAGCRRAAVEAGGPVTIKFWNGFTGPDGATMERMVAAFQRENPDVRVAMQVIPWGQYYDKLTLGLAFDSGPDLFVLHVYRLPEFARYKALRPLDDLLASTEALATSDFLPIPWQAAHYKGRLYAVPLDCHPLGLYYNRALFRQAGIVNAKGEPKPPADWAEFVADAKKLTGFGRPDRWGFAITNRATNWYTFLRQHGASTLTPDLRRCGLDTPAAREATEQLRSLVTPLHVAPAPEGVDAWLGFRQGRVAMCMEGIYMLADLRKTEGLDYGGAPAPRFGPVPAVWGGSHMLCMPARASAAHTRAAWRLVRYLSDHSLDWADGGQTPVRRSLRDTPRFRAMTVQATFATQVPYVCYDMPSEKATEIGPFLDACAESSLLGLQPPQTALREAAARINRVLERP